MNWHEPILTKEHGAYALIGIAVIAALSWIVGRMLSYREPGSDPMADAHGDVPNVEETP